MTKDNNQREALLVRFADGTASQLEQEQARQLIRTDQTAATLLKQLEQSRLPPAERFNHELPPADKNAVDSIRQWQPAERQTRRFGFEAIAATLIAGVVAGHLLTSFFNNNQTTDSNSQIANSEHTTPEWIRLVADYHRLYTRDTVSGASALPAAEVGLKVTTWLDRSTSIPVLNDMGLEFKRAQRLTVENDTLVQLAYLPEKKNPVAICIRKTVTAKNSEVTIAQYKNMRYAEWQDGKHAIVIVGELSTEEIEQIANTAKATLFKQA